MRELPAGPDLLCQQGEAQGSALTPGAGTWAPHSMGSVTGRIQNSHVFAQHKELYTEGNRIQD